VAVAAALSFIGCSGPVTDAPVFQHDVATTNKPWTHDQFDSAEDKFTFAVFSDLTGGERPRIFEIAVAQLNLLRPELIINVGDLIQGETTEPDKLAVEWRSFDERADRAMAPVFYVGGNHDLTGEPLQRVWDRRYGRRYYHLVYRDVLFLVLDTESNTPERTQEIFEIRRHGIEVYDTEGLEAYVKTAYHSLPERKYGNITAEQSSYFREVIADNPNVRWTFLFMHKAPWEQDGEQNFAAIEQALSEQQYTVFHGHEHFYQHVERNGHDYIRLATTGGSQFPGKGLSADHITLVTVGSANVDIANLLLSGILDKTGHIPLDGDDICFAKADCGNDIQK
jgi:predicted MPP superfamily phosphohydrolase